MKVPKYYEKIILNLYSILKRENFLFQDIIKIVFLSFIFIKWNGTSIMESLIRWKGQYETISSIKTFQTAQKTRHRVPSWINFTNWQISDLLKTLFAIEARKTLNILGCFCHEYLLRLEFVLFFSLIRSKIFSRKAFQRSLYKRH